MQWEYAAGGIMVVGLLGYLAYALIFPESF